MPPSFYRALVLVLVAAAAGWAGAWLALGRPGVALAALAFALPHAPVLGIEFVLLGTAGRRAAAGGVPPAPGRVLLAAWWHELWMGVRVFGWQQGFAAAAEPDHLPADATGRRGVVLVHGLVCNRGVWQPWLRRLRARGVPAVAVDLRPTFAPIERYVPTLEAAVDRLHRATGVAPLIVAHSMGGLVARAWRRERGAAARCAGLVTIATPHRGTWLARFALTPNTRQMHTGSAWLGRLHADEAGGSACADVTCFYSDADNMVFPPERATLPGADNRLLRGQAHVALLAHPAVFEAVLARLDAPAR